MEKLAQSQLRREDVRHYVKNTIDVFVQLERSAGKRRVSAVSLA